jgi:RES domain-containing protein
VFGNRPNEQRLIPTDQLTSILEGAPLVPFAGFTYRVIAERWRASPLSAIGSFERGGRYNTPGSFAVLYSADSPVTALQETESLFATQDGQLWGIPRDPEIILTLECTLFRLLDLTTQDLYRDLGTTRDELVSLAPSRFILNARNEETPTQRLGSACVASAQISAIRVPSAQRAEGYCLNIFIGSLIVGERVAVLDSTGRLKAEILGTVSSTNR